MLKVIADPSAIKRCVTLFHKQFKLLADEDMKVRLGHQGASFAAKIQWSKRLGIWTYSKSVKNVRYGNAFGVDKPGEHSVLSIASEINFPWESIDRKIGGAFAEDHWNNIFVIHRGKIGGGKRGVGKSLFEDHYRGVWSYMEDGDTISEVAVIGALKSERFALQAAHFVKKVEKLKSAAASSLQMEIHFPEIAFREELVGTRLCLPEGDIPFACEHDVVVVELAAVLRRMRMKVGNDTQNDLFVFDAAQNRITHHVEIVANPSEINIMAAVGRLLLQSAHEDSQPILVVPEERTDQIAGDLHRLRIAVVDFHWQNQRAVFSGLEKIFSPS